MSDVTPSWVIQKGSDVCIHITVSPRASRDAVQGLHDHRLKIALKAPPVDGEANKALIRFLSKQLSIPRSRIRLDAGHTHRKKTIILQESQVNDALNLLNGHKVS